MTKLDEMANSVNVARGVAGIVLENFQKISLARKRMWTWAQITAAIADAYPDMHFTESAVQSAFKRIERGVQHKRIKPLGKPSLNVGKNDGNEPVVATNPRHKPLQRVGTNKTKNESEMSAQEKLIASIPHI